MMNKAIAPLRGASRVVLAIAMAGGCAFAQAEPAAEVPEVELAPVTVSAHDGVAVPYDQTGVSVSVLDVEQLKKEGMFSLSEALTTVPGIYVMPGGGSQRGNTSDVAIRGMSSGQNLLPMMDGMRLFTSSGGCNFTPNIVGRSDLFSMGTVELLRGAQGAAYGAGAMGGVLYMETPEGKGEPSLTLFNEAGSFDSYTGNAVAQGRVDDFSYFVSATYSRTNNDMEYADNRPVTHPHAGKAESWQEAIRLDYRPHEDDQLTLTYRREDSEYRNLGADYGYGVTCDLYNFRSNLLTAKYQAKLSDKLTSSLMAGYYGTNYTFHSDMYGNTYPQVRNVQIEWRNAYKWNEQHTTTAGFAWNRSKLDSPTTASKSSSYDSLDNTYAFFAEHNYSPAKGWDNSLALRWDQSSVFDGLATFRAASSYKFNEEKTRAFGSVGMGYKAPYQLQRGGVYQGGWTSYKGNPDLDCSKDISVDFGVEHQFARNHYASATLFWSRVTDGITEVASDEPGYNTFINDSSHWTIQGIELALRGTWEKRWNTGYRLAYTYTQPKTADDSQIAQTSRQTISADIHTSPVEGLETGFGFVAASGRNDYAGNRLDNYYSLRWYANYAVNENLSLHLRVENLTDQKFIMSSNAGSNGWGGSLINSGAAVYGGCTLRF